MRRLLLTFILTVVGSGISQAAPTEEEQRGACEGDVMKLCSPYVPDRDRIAACMTVNRRQLTPACRVVFDASSKAGKSR